MPIHCGLASAQSLTHWMICSKCLGSAWSSEAGEEGLSACEAAALKPVQQHFDKGVANFSDMVAASLQP